MYDDREPWILLLKFEIMAIEERGECAAVTPSTAKSHKQNTQLRGAS
jgi:hypothetical protein